MAAIRLVTHVNPRDRRRTDRQERPVRAQIGAGCRFGEPAQSADRTRLGRSQEGRRRLERDGEQLGFATIKILGQQVAVPRS